MDVCPAKSIAGLGSLSSQFSSCLFLIFVFGAGPAAGDFRQRLLILFGANLNPSACCAVCNRNAETRPTEFCRRPNRSFVNTGRDEAEKFKLGEFMMSLQPDTYVMHGVENAAGYDGFGLARYSRLAGDMKLWGELTDPERSVRGPGREFDLLNVRYLVRQSPRGEMQRRAAERAPLGVAPQAAGAPQLTILGGVPFGQTELGAPSLLNGERLMFAIAADRSECDCAGHQSFLVGGC